MSSCETWHKKQNATVLYIIMSSSCEEFPLKGSTKNGKHLMASWKIKLSEPSTQLLLSKISFCIFIFHFFISYSIKEHPLSFLTFIPLTM